MALQVSGEGKESDQEGLVGMSGSSFGSLYSILSSILSSSSSTGNFTSAGLLPLDSSVPDAPSHVNESLPSAIESSKMPHSSSPVQSASQQVANAAGRARKTQQEPFSDTAGNNWSKKHRGKRPQPGFGGVAHVSLEEKATRLFSTPSPDTSTIGGRPNELHTREDDRSMEDAVHDRASSDSEVPANRRRLAKSKGKRRLQQEEEAAAELLHHVLKSKYKGVSCHKQTLRWESSLWLNGRQVYLGGFATEQEAAHAYDLAALGCKGSNAEINFPLGQYADVTTELQFLSQDEVISWVRRRSNAFARGKSQFRGVSGRQGRWETRIGSFGGLKNVSFGVHEDEEVAGRMYDRAMILQKGRSAKTNFPMTDYDVEVAAYKTFCAERYGMLDASAAQEKSKAVTLPLEDFIEAEQLAAQGKGIKKKGRARKVKGIFAADLEAALMRNRYP
ncbi:g5128 [Coccomyxa elongata]